MDRTDQQLEGETLRLASGHLLGAEEDTAPRTYQGFLAKAEPVVEGSCTGDSWLKPVFSLLPLQPTQTEPLAAETCPCVSLLSPCRPLTPATGPLYVWLPQHLFQLPVQTTCACHSHQPRSQGLFPGCPLLWIPSPLSLAAPTPWPPKHTLGLLKHHRWDADPSGLNRIRNEQLLGFTGGSVVKNPPALQETRVRSLIREDPMCCGATKPVLWSLGAATAEPTATEACKPRASAPQQGRAPQREAGPRQLESSPQGNGDPAQPKIK